ncbi:MAG: glycosyltransferase family 9 protein [Bdellovibrionia bacterium]
MKLRSLGDTVLMTAALAQVQKAFAESRIDVLVPSEWAPLLENTPGVFQVIPFQRESNPLKKSASLGRLAWRLRAENYDLVINFHASSTSAWLARATGAKSRAIHFHGHSHRNRFSTHLIAGKGQLKPIIERDMDAVRSLGIHVPAGRLPQIFLNPSEIAQAKTHLEQLGLRQPVLGISLGASRATKIWPLQRAAVLAFEWQTRQNGGVFVTAGPQEKHLTHEFLKLYDDLILSSVTDTTKRAQLRCQIYATTELSIRSLAAYLSQLSVLACNDSGPKHLAIAVGTPTVSVFGPEHPFEWHPYPEDQHPYVFVEPLACRTSGNPERPAWCGLSTCIQEDHQCMKLIGVNSVLSHCERIQK